MCVYMQAETHTHTHTHDQVKFIPGRQGGSIDLKINALVAYFGL